MQIKIVILFMFILTQNCFADVFQNRANISSFVNEIPQMNSISCKFKQEKTIKGIEKPLISGGNFKFVKDKGIFFDTTYPIKSSTSYTTGEYKQINSIINAISNKKYKNLENEFDFYFNKENAKWNLGLKPKQTAQSARYISSIQISGRNIIDKIIIDTTNGNKISQWFYQE